MSVRDALTRYLNRNAREKRQANKKRNNPEKQVEKEILLWAEKMGFDLTVVDSGFVHWSQKKVSETGFSDLVGNFDGTAVFIELKAPYQKRTPSASQYFFLERKIKSGCFACVTDSSLHIDELWQRWLGIVDADARKKMLLKELKKPRNVDERSLDDSPIFDE